MNAGIVVDNELNIDKRVLREIGILKESGHTVSVLCFGFKHEKYNNIEGINVNRIIISRKFKNIMMFILNIFPLYEWLWAKWISGFIILNGIEVLHVHDLYMSKAGRSGIIKSRKQIPMILDLHENFSFTVKTYNWTKGFFRHLVTQPERWADKEKQYLHYADRYIVLSIEYKDLLISRYSGIPSDSFTVLPNVPDLEQIAGIKIQPVPDPFNNYDPVILYYGVIAERRGIFDTLNVLAKLADEDIRVNFLFIGPVDKKDRSRFYNMISDKKISDRVHHIPWIDSLLFWSYLEISDICIAPFHKNPQHESGVANKVYEYMLGSKPVVVSDCRPQMELIQKYQCGLVFRDEKEMHDAFVKLAYDADLRTEMGKNARKAIIEDYNMSKVKHNLISLYHQLA